MTRRMISGDSHIDLSWLPAELFVSNAPRQFRDRMPRVEETVEGKRWYVGTKPFTWVASSGSDFGDDRYIPGVSQRLDRMEKEGFFSDAEQGLFRVSTPELRLRDQDLDGVAAEVIYGILGMSAAYGARSPWSNSSGGLTTAPGVDDAEALAVVYEIYNEWIAQFCNSKPSRFAGLACLTGTSPDIASRQLRRAADIGLRGAELDVSAAVEPIYHSDWDALWATAAECDMPISFHTLGVPLQQPKESELEKYRWVRAGLMYTLFQLSGAEFLVSIILSGACDRYPDFKFVLGECGVGWIPYVLHRMDEEYENFSSSIGLSMKPSDFWARQGYSTFQDEELSEEVLSLVGVDNIIWGSDYPHPDGIWPDSREIIERSLGHLDEGTLSKLVHDNAERLYRIPPSE
jgi:predicted TIM-barrel fold metal-dependent hydrolase